MAFFHPWGAALLAWEAICVLWVVTSMLNWSGPERRDWRRASVPSAIYGMFVAVGAALLFWKGTAIGLLGHSILPAPRTGVVVTYLGAAFAGLARLSLGANWSSRARIRAAHTLSTSGPYRVLRHPIYAGLLCSYLGTAMILGEVRGYVGFAVTFVAWWLKSRVEDRLLAARFGPEFEAYRQRTRAIIPGVL